MSTSRFRTMFAPPLSGDCACGAHDGEPCHNAVIHPDPGSRDLDAEQRMGATQREAAALGYPIVGHDQEGRAIYGPPGSIVGPLRLYTVANGLRTSCNQAFVYQVRASSPERACEIARPLFAWMAARFQWGPEFSSELTAFAMEEVE